MPSHGTRLERRGMLSASVGALAESALVDRSGEASAIVTRAGASATFYATSLADGVAPGSLRQAVIQANATPAADLDILHNLTIQGAGETQTIIDASALGDRLFDARGANLVIKNAAIRGGRAQHGAGVSMVDGNLTLQNCRLIDNIATGVDDGDGEGGGVGGAIQSAEGGLSISRSSFAYSLAQGGAAATGNTAGIAAGGALHCDPASDLLMTGSTVRKNRALGSTGRGGGIYLEPSSGVEQIRRTVVAQSTASTDGNNIYG